MRTVFKIVAPALAGIALLTGGTAFAEGRLVTSTPAADASASNVKTLSLGFSEAPVEKLSGVEIVMTAMPGMTDHPPMHVKGFTTALGGDGKTLVLTLPRALPAGTYDVNWHVVTADTQRSEGSYTFKVR